MLALPLLSETLAERDSTDSIVRFVMEVGVVLVVLVR